MSLPDQPGRGRPARRRRAQARLAAEAKAIAAALAARGVVIPAPVELSPAPPRRIYRSSDVLGDRGYLAPADLDWSTCWLAKIDAPGRETETHCLDEALGADPSEYQARMQADADRRRAIQDAGPRRLEVVRVHRVDGRLRVDRPLPPGGPAAQPDGPCQTRNLVEPILVPIPHTRLRVE